MPGPRRRRRGLAFAALVVAVAAARAAPSLFADAPPPPVAEPIEYAARHILVSYAGSSGPAATRTKPEAEARAAEARAALVKPGADFAAVSHAFSDDLAADAWGGFLGMLDPPALDPALKGAITALKEGEISAVVATAFGFHVIQRMTTAEGLQILATRCAAVYAAAFPFQAEGAPGAAPRSREQALADAVKAQALLGGGTSFPELEKAAGAAPVQKDWVFPVLLAGRSAPEFQAAEKAAFALTVGQVSAPVESPYGWLVMKRRPWFHMHAQHVLVMHATSEMHRPEISRTKEEAQARAAEAYRAVIADPASWAKVVAAYSDEPGAPEHGGSVGAVEPGAFDPRFEAAILRLTPGGPPDVVETDFGFHVLRRLD